MAKREKECATDCITGCLEKVRYHQSNFLIGILDNGTTVKGDMISPQIGLEYKFSGTWDNHPRWGKQFAFLQYSVEYPTDLNAIRLYLKENCKWIGPQISRVLIKKYGKDTLQVCKEQPDTVASEISGITLRRAKEIAAMLRNNEADEKLQLAINSILGGARISKRAVNKIIEKWGHEAPDRIKNNPYALIDEIDGVGFIVADEIARKIGYDPNGSPRIGAGILYALKEQAYSGGHTCLPMSTLVEEAVRILNVRTGRIDEEIIVLCCNDLIVVHDNHVSLKKFDSEENYIVEKLKMLLREKLSCGEPNIDGLAEDQIDAVKKATESSVFILTGAPGTGKTYTIKRIIESFADGGKIALAAPTGKAAKRIFEQSGYQALTIHKLLEPQKVDDKFRFTRNEDNPLELGTLILDEVSMIDVSLFASLMRALQPKTRLILVGDVYQLPPVGPGNILKDLIASGMIPTTELTIIKRQDEGLIVRNCHRIKQGLDIEIDNSNANDFFFIDLESDDAIKEKILELVSRRLPESYKADPLRDIQVITPLREKTSLSCRSLNKVFQERLNNNAGGHLKIGDKVIQTKNQYDLDIINGDIGYVTDIVSSGDKKVISIQFENPMRDVDLPLNNNNLELAYAITCHKFQGSESKIIAIPIHKSFGPFIMQRNWIYTAISRAKEVCVLVGHRSEVPLIIKRNAQIKRHTRLVEKLSRREGNDQNSK